MQQPTLIAHQIAILSLTNRTAFRSGQVEAAIAGGVLSELVLMERVMLRRGSLDVIDSRPTDEPVLDLALEYLTKHKRRPAMFITMTLRQLATQAYKDLNNLRVAGQMPNFLTSMRMPALLDPQAKTQIVDQIRQSLENLDRATPRAISVAGLSSQTGLWRKLLPELGMARRGELERQLRKRDWIVESVYAWRVAASTTMGIAAAN